AVRSLSERLLMQRYLLLAQAHVVRGSCPCASPRSSEQRLSLPFGSLQAQVQNGQKKTPALPPGFLYLTRTSRLEIALNAQAAFPSIVQVVEATAEQDRGIRVETAVHDLDTEIETGNRRPDQVGADAPLVEVEAERAVVRDVSIGAEQVLTNGRGPVVTHTTGNGPAFAGRDFAIGVDEGINDVDVRPQATEAGDACTLAEAEVAKSAVSIGRSEPKGITRGEHRQVDGALSRHGPAVLGVRDRAKENVRNTIRNVGRGQDVAALLVQSARDLERAPGTSVLQVSNHVRHALT